MRKSIIAAILIVLCFQTFPIEVIDLSEIETRQDILRRCLVRLVVQLEIVLEIVTAENVSPELRDAIRRALHICREILAALEYD